MKRDNMRQKEICNTRGNERNERHIQRERSNTRQLYLRKWAPGANNRATLISFTNLKISLAVPCSVFGRGA